MAQYQSFPDTPGASQTLEKLKALNLPDLGGRSFLDVGCNEGFFCGFADFVGASRSVGIDKSALFIERARRRFPGCEFVQREWSDLPQGPFDVILLASALHYADDQAALISKLVELLSPDGVLVLELGIFSSHDNEWIEVDRGFDRRLYPTMRKMKDVLAPYAWKWMGPSVRQAGDPVERHVMHVSRRKPTAYLLMLPPGYGKSSIANALFPKAGVQLVSGDEVVARIAAGAEVAVSPELAAFVRKQYSPYCIDRVVEAAFDEGLGSEFAGALASQAQGADFALDAFIPLSRQQQVRTALRDMGYFVVDLSWDRMGIAPSPRETAMERIDLFAAKLADTNPSVATGSSELTPAGSIDEVAQDHGVVTIRGWAIDEGGQLPADWKVKIGYREREVIRLQVQARPDVQAHLGLIHGRVGFVLEVRTGRALFDFGKGKVEVQFTTEGGTRLSLVARLPNTSSEAGGAASRVGR